MVKVMSEIERLEQEIKEKKAMLRQLKSEKAKGERLNFQKYRMFRADRFAYFGCSDHLVNPLREFVLVLSTINKNKCEDCTTESIHVSCHKPKVKDIDEQRLRVCNDFIDEIHPIVSKYVDIFLEIGEPHDGGGRYNQPM